MSSHHQKGYLFKSIFLVVFQVFFFQIAHLTCQQQDGFAADSGLSAISKNNAASCEVGSIESDQSELTLIEGEETVVIITIACKRGDLPQKELKSQQESKKAKIIFLCHRKVE